MHNNAIIYEELKELNSWLVDISNKNVFTVPEGYFDSLSSHILQSISNHNPMDEMDIPVLNMQVPEGYFDGLADEIMNKIKANDIEQALEEYPPLLASVRYQNVFKVPDDYFDSLSQNILKKLPQRPAKIVSLKPGRSFFRYAAAAAITGIIGLSFFSMLDKKTGMPTVSESTTGVVEKGYEIIKNNAFDKAMDALGDDEILSYLKADGEDLNAALVASLTDEKNLPNVDAYFTDEKTLDNFLNEQNIVQSSND